MSASPVHDSRDEPAISIARRPAAWALDAMLRGYQRFISPMLPPACRFTPSCSCYARRALREHHSLSAMRLIAWRLLRCQPLCVGGYDPVPPGRLTRSDPGVDRAQRALLTDSPVETCR